MQARLTRTLLLASALFALALAVRATLDTEPLYPDLFGLWTFGSYVLGHEPASIYDQARLAAYQHGLGLPNESGLFPFPYPPWILLLLAPLGALPYPAMALLWRLGGFVLMALATAAWRWPRPLRLLLLLAPSTAVSVVVGQNGFLSAALMLGGLRLLPTHPIAAGALLATLGYKPQLALLVPALLVFGRHWRALATATATAALLTLVSVAAFGWAMWPAWLGALRDVGAATGRLAQADMMPTIALGTWRLTHSVPLAQAAQAAGLTLAIYALWRLRGRTNLVAQAAFPLATLLATPYAFGYDLPILTGALVPLLMGAELAPGLLIATAACLLTPAILWTRPGVLTALTPLLYAATLLALMRPATPATHAEPRPACPDAAPPARAARP